MNDSMGGYIGKKVVKNLIRLGRNVMSSRVLVMGITFKEDVSDIRNSKVVDIIRELRLWYKVDIVDPHAGGAECVLNMGLRWYLHLSPTLMSSDRSRISQRVSEPNRRVFQDPHHLSRCLPRRHQRALSRQNPNPQLLEPVDLAKVFRRTFLRTSLSEFCTP